MDIGSYFNYALRLWSFDKSAAQELRDSKSSSFWMSFLLIAIFGSIIGSVSVVAEMFNPSNDLAEIGTALYLVGGILGSIILVPLFYLLGMLWSQMWINIFGGDRKFLKTFEVFACIYIPSFIVGFIVTLIQLFLTLSIENETTLAIAMILPGLISFVVGIYAIFVIVKTFSITHNMGIGNALLAGLVSTISIIIISFVIIFIFAFIFAVMFGLSTLNV